MIKLNKKHLCNAIMVVYHLLFLGGTTTLVSGYIGEIKELRTEIKRQGDKAKKIVKNVKTSTDKISNDLNKVAKACKRFF